MTLIVRFILNLKEIVNYSFYHTRKFKRDELKKIKCFLCLLSWSCVTHQTQYIERKKKTHQ